MEVAKEEGGGEEGADGTGCLGMVGAAVGLGSALPPALSPFFSLFFIFLPHHE